MNKRGFTLVELLIVIAIIALLAALLFPVFLSVRAKGRQVACTSNLHQLGLAVSLYAQDSDGLFPYGGDPTDLQTDGWQTAEGGQFWPEGHEMPRLQDVLRPYVQAADVWRCPSDAGFNHADFSSGDLDAHPSEYEQYGVSYSYRTELALRHKSFSTLTGYEKRAPYTEHGVSEINLLCDQVGTWHGGGTNERFNVLMIDGHVVSLPYGRTHQAWNLVLDKPGP